MKRSGLICFVLLLVALGVDARNRHGRKYKSAARTTLAHVAEGDYDIKHLKFNLQVSDTSVFIKGDVTTTAQVIVPTMGSYLFELDTLMIIDSAKINGTIYPVVSTGYLRGINLATSLVNGDIFKAQIFYHGVPPPGGGFFNGLRHTISAGGTNMLYSVSDPWVAKVWWPAKQSVNDLIDSVDMYITTPAGVADGSNGVLVGIDNITTPGYSTYHWKTNYPIAYYLICINVAKYGEYKSYWHFTGSPDSMLIQNFFMDTATFNATSKINFDSIGMMIDYFSSLFGRYPFWREKYGVCFTDLPGGMEHQTMTTIGVTDTKTIAHELTHQWFGDNVTYRSWHETWLSEGFATYAEQLYYAQFWSAAKAKSHRQAQLNSALGLPCGMIYVNDTTNADSLFNQRTVYKKAQGIIHTLRYMAPADSLFFRALKTYQQTFAGKNASTADFKNIMETTYGMNLDTFFNQWIYGRGYPIYKPTWFQSGSTVYVKLVQTQSCPSYTKHFSTPLQIQLHSATSDTFIKIYSSLDTQIFTFDWSPTMTNLYVNPDVWTVCRVSTPILQDSTLSVSTVNENHNIRVFPNPSKNYWQVEQLAYDAGLVLTDINGRVLWQGKSVNGRALIPGERLPSGNYLLKVTSTNSTESIRLVRW